MDSTIVVAIVTGIFALAAAYISANAAGKKTANEIAGNMRVSQAVTDTKIEALTNEVREHNNFARRMPVVEEQIKVINHRIEDLEKGR